MNEGREPKRCRRLSIAIAIFALVTLGLWRYEAAKHAAELDAFDFVRLHGSVSWASGGNPISSLRYGFWGIQAFGERGVSIPEKMLNDHMLDEHKKIRNLQRIHLYQGVASESGRIVLPDGISERLADEFPNLMISTGPAPSPSFRTIPLPSAQ